MIPKWLERWGERRKLGRRAFVSWFLWRRWFWCAALLGGVYGLATFRLLSSVLHYSVLEAASQALAWLAGVILFMMAGGYLVAMAIWSMNERRYVRDVEPLSTAAGPK